MSQPQNKKDYVTASSVPLSELRKRFNVDSADGYSANYSSQPLATVRNPTTRGIFGATITDSDLVFASAREPAGFRIVHGVAKDVLDNWFTVEVHKKDGEGNKVEDTGEVNDFVQKELNRLKAKLHLRKLLSFDRCLGTSILILNFDDASENLAVPVKPRKGLLLRAIEAYSRLEIRKIVEVKNPNSDRDGYPEFYLLKSNSGMQTSDRRVHYSRVIHCATLLTSHRYLGESQLKALYDDMLSGRYMRWGMYQTIIRYGSGYPDVTIQGADDAVIQEYIDEGHFDDMNARNYFVHNEGTSLDFKGTGGATLNPQPYLQMMFDVLSLGSSIPEPKLKGAQAGALTGSEHNTSDYFKYVSGEQTEFESVIRQLIDTILVCGGKMTFEQPLDYSIKWKEGFELTQTEVANLDLTVAQTAQLEGNFMTVNEVRQRRWKLPPLQTKDGELSDRGFELLSAGEANNGVEMQTNYGLSPQTLFSQLQASNQQNKKEDEDTEVEAKTKLSFTGDSADNSDVAKTSLPVLMQELGKRLLRRELTGEEAIAEGTVLINQFYDLEMQKGKLWMQYKLKVPNISLPPEMQRQLQVEKEQMMKDLQALVKETVEQLNQNGVAETETKTKK